MECFRLLKSLYYRSQANHQGGEMLQMTQSKALSVVTAIFVVGAVLVWLLHFGGVAVAGPYADSGHGDTIDGVNRSTGTCENWPGGVCSTGFCAHCHDTFDPTICGNNTHGLMLFAPNDSPSSQTDNFCFQCHKGAGSVQVGGITNETYSTNFGGGTSTFDTIYDAFNPTTGDTPSSHNLADVLNHAVGRGIGFTSDTNACLVCHDQHLAQQNYPVTLSGLGGVKTAVRRPLDYPSPGSPSNLWGDEDYATSGSNERMLDFTAKYQAPYYVGGTTYEPANDSTINGSNLPNFKNFCLSQCHERTDVYSTERSVNLTQIDWGPTGDHRHGKYHSDDGGMGYTIAPYTNGETYNYVLSCTDCHETHGSENEWLLRTCVNGKDNIIVPTVEEVNGNWYDFCTACHVLTGSTTTFHRKYSSPAPPCPDCHRHGQTLPQGL